MPARLQTETLRKWLHLAPGVLAFGVRDLGAAGSLALLAGLLGFNLWLFPRLGSEELWRAEERRRGASPGILLYPIALLLLAAASRGRLEVLAGGWGMLAFGDAAATLAGRRWGRRGLPWNREKSWVGAMAFTLAAWASVVILVHWTTPGRTALPALLWAAAAAAVVGAVVESLPWTLDDNVSVTLLGGGALYVALEIAAGGCRTLPVAPSLGLLALVAVFTLVGLKSGAFDSMAALAGAAVGVGVALGTGWRGLVLLGLFVAAGTAVTRARRAASKARARERPRRVRNVLANGSVAAACGLLAGCRADESLVAAVAGALAVAVADTVGGEIGFARGARTWRITDGSEVPPGTDGGVSWPGVAATVGCSAAWAGVAVAIGLVRWEVGGVVALVGVAGALLDSVLGATLERRSLLDNESVNLLSTLVGAWAAALAVDVWLGP